MATKRTATGTFLGTCSRCRQKVRTDEKFVKHSICGGWITNYTEIKARITEHECGVKCTSALGPSCDCTCAGKNHGADHR